MLGPPVQMHRSTALISPAERSIVGSGMIWIRFSGIPSFFSSAFISSTVFTPTFFARGCGQMMIALPHFIAQAELCMTVMTGFVVGVTEPITPMGLATLAICVSSSQSMMPRLFLPFMPSHTVLDLLRHLAILLS